MVSCPSHPSREAPPERGGYRKPILVTWFRAPPTPPGRPRLSKEGIGSPHYLNGFVSLPLTWVRRRGAHYLSISRATPPTEE
eukprot:2367597-Pyramimonas_sp.AAC.1